MNLFLRRLKSLSVIGLLAIAACGPIIVPMGRQLTPDEQQLVDESWQRALTADDDLGRQGWLDLMVGTLAFEHGVDRFQFKSEKQVDDRLVVMEVRFDRAKPDEDAFEVTVFDGERKILRKERYNRADVEESIAVMYDTNSSLDAQSENWKRLVQDREARRDRIQGIFPRPEAVNPFDPVERPADAEQPANRN